MRPLIIALVLGLTAAAPAVAAPQPPDTNACFASNSWEGWSAPNGGDVLYLRVRMHDIYRVDLTPGSHVRKSGDRFLVNRVRGSGWICSPLDLDLTLRDHHGFHQPVIARALRKLTAEEVAAIPRADLPA